MTERQNEVQPYLNELSGKINTLQFIAKNLQDVSITIEVTFSDGDKLLLDQKLFPFNLGMELRCLIDDSIDDYQRRLKNLSHASDY